MISERQAHKYCRDDISKIENYDKAISDTIKWELHHRLELTLDGEFALTEDQLKMHRMYFHRPYYELIFLRHDEHRRIHGQARSEDCKRKKSKSLMGHIVSAETRSKLSKSSTGRKFTEEWLRKLREAKKNISEETRRKMSESAKRRPCNRKGVRLSDETKRKISEAHRRRREMIH